VSAYYNEHDPFAAAWLRELIADGLIAPGEVDERSIEDVRPDELANKVKIGRTQIANMEMGRGVGSLGTIAEIAGALGVGLKELLP
jgi:transcriptional regulator with XRE-family HTH domain